MFDPERLLGQMLGGGFGTPRGRRNRSMFGGGQLAGKARIGIGLLGIALAAWEHHQQKSGVAGAATGAARAHAATMSSPPPPPAASATSPPPPPPNAQAPTRAMPLLDERQQSVVLLIRSMIAAANADGHIDDSERNIIVERAQRSGLDAEALAFLDAELARPQTLQQVIANATPERASETYAAAAFAISADNDAERTWLDALAQGLKLDPAIRTDLDQRIAAAQPAA